MSRHGRTHMHARRLAVIALAVLTLFAFAMAGSASASTPVKLETITVNNAVSTPVQATTVLRADHSYRLDASGEVSDWTSDSSGVFNGAAWGVDPLYCYATWRCATPELWRQLQVNGKGLDEFGGVAGAIAYNPAHAYSVTRSGVSGRLSLVGLDAVGSSGDNSGSWSVDLWDLGLSSPNLSFSFTGYANNVRGRPRWQLGETYFRGSGTLHGSADGTTSTRNLPTFYPDHSMSTTVTGWKFTQSAGGLRRTLVLHVKVRSSTNRRACRRGTRGTVTLVDDDRRRRNRQTRDSITTIYPTSRCPAFVQGTSNRDNPQTNPTFGGPGGGQWAKVEIAIDL